MANRKIICDKSEIILLDERDNDRIYNFTSDQIKQIQINYCNEFSWFRKVPSEKIEIFANKFTEPFVFLKGKNKQYFQEYKSELSEFASNNRITFDDFTNPETEEKEYQSQVM